jgi:hypothetical protein
VGQLLKVGKGGRALSARIDPTNLSALPIYPAALVKDDAEVFWQIKFPIEQHRPREARQR